ncbi:MAG: VanW family protein [Defluviitaleaceae bacterium]|nr:VanW family protein [Defluviitaleaceae bacterium]
MTPKKILFVYMLAAAALIIFAGCSSYQPKPIETLPLPTEISDTADVVPRRSSTPATPAPLPSPAPSPRRSPRRQEVSIPMPTPQATQASQVLATHETKFDVKAKNRATNITKAAAAIDGYIVRPGEIFSYNETVGPTNKQRGYKKDTIYLRGVKKKGFGGGVCQVSTTLYNAAANAGMTILERHDHSLPVAYAKRGDEAATSYGGIDFKFQNDKPFPVRINCKTENGTISATINAV